MMKKNGGKNRKEYTQQHVGGYDMTKIKEEIMNNKTQENKDFTHTFSR